MKITALGAIAARGLTASALSAGAQAPDPGVELATSLIYLVCR